MASLGQFMGRSHDKLYIEMNSLTILLHSSKTMRKPLVGDAVPTEPLLISKAEEIGAYLKTLSVAQIQKSMAVSPVLAEKTSRVIRDWHSDIGDSSLAMDSFVGDIYSGLQAASLNAQDREYANQHLRILSGLYGILRPNDGVLPYRLEMGYRLPDEQYKSLPKFWNTAIAETLPKAGVIVNLAAVEYNQTITPYVEQCRVVTPKFLTRDARTGEPGSVVVHTKIARGAFAHWLITSRVQQAVDFDQFHDLGYSYEPLLSTPLEPVFVCNQFGGIGLSIRLR